jgi:hypothetical protein
MRGMTDRATFAQSQMLEHHRFCLLSMALRARFVQTPHRYSARRLLDIDAVGIVALYTVHVAFDDGVMLREMKLRLNVRMALHASRRIFARIDDKFFKATAPAHRDVFAARPVAGLAAVLAF